MRQFGATEATVKRWLRKAAERLASKRPETGLLVHPDNIVAVKLLDAMQTQWRTEFASTWSRSIPIYLGLKYEALEPTARMAGLGEISPDDFHRIRVLEAVVLKTWGEQRK